MFVIHSPRDHWVAAMNECHHDAGYQGQQQMLCFLHDWFWWPGMATQMQKAISSSKLCSQHEGIHAKAPVWPIFVTAPWSCCMLTLPALRPQWSWINPQMWWTFGLLWPLYETCHGIHDPPVKLQTVAMFLWQGYILIFRAPAKLLSDWGANFESNIIRELCGLISI